LQFIQVYKGEAIASPFSFGTVNAIDRKYLYPFIPAPLR